MATEGSRSSTSSADSYIGSLISLTSKSEIRYEGILYNINTEESSIGLTNVRSFGTEGRKKDGPQLMPSDKVYEYILFRGSDIKDLQVKSSQPVQPTQPINSDPAIIQSHYPQPAAPSSTLPTTVSNISTNPSTNTANLGHNGPTFQNGPPLYQPGGNNGPWGPPPPPQNTTSNGLPMPMYWPGYYAPPQLPRPPQGLGLGMPPSLQQPIQYPNFNNSLSSGPPPSMSTPNVPEYSSSLLSTSASSATLTTPNSLLSATGSLPNLLPNNLPNLAVTTPAVTGDVNVNVPLPNVNSDGKFVPNESVTPALVTPGQLLQSVPAGVSVQPTQVVRDDVEVVQVSQALSSSPPSVSAPVVTEAQPPILPLPPQAQIAPKANGATYHNRQNYNYRGRERGRGSGVSRPVMKFTEEFDFSAMNEKFNKDEVWGTLGKSTKEKDGNGSDEDEYEEENDHNFPKVDTKPVYSKDDFFDTLSSNTSDRQQNNGRTRFSEQMKLDTETFGEFSRYRGGGRGGRGPYRGGRSRGGGYYGRGYGYNGRGRGMRNQTQTQTQSHDY